MTGTTVISCLELKNVSVHQFGTQSFKTIHQKLHILSVTLHYSIKNYKIMPVILTDTFENCATNHIFGQYGGKTKLRSSCE